MTNAARNGSVIKNACVSVVFKHRDFRKAEPRRFSVEEKYASCVRLVLAPLARSVRTCVARAFNPRNSTLGEPTAKSTSAGASHGIQSTVSPNCWRLGRVRFFRATLLKFAGRRKASDFRCS